jgi:hypothetical protein
MDDLDVSVVSVADEGNALALSPNAMQLDSPTLMTIDDLPDDILRLIVLFLPDVNENGLEIGSMNVLRRVSKRLMRVVESCATRLTSLQYIGSVSIPFYLRRCTSIRHITCSRTSLKSLEGCPSGLKSLDISGYSIYSLEPLRGCTELESLVIDKATCISDLSPLSSCTKLKRIHLRKLLLASDLSPLSTMPLLEELTIWGCQKIERLDPLSGLLNLQRLDCRGIGRLISLLPLLSCAGLKELRCDFKAKDLEKFKEKVPGLRVTHDYY